MNTVTYAKDINPKTPHCTCFENGSRKIEEEFQPLMRRILWRLQALQEGDLSERARRRARELADLLDLLRRRPSTEFFGFAFFPGG